MNAYYFWFVYFRNISYYYRNIENSYGYNFFSTKSVFTPPNTFFILFLPWRTASEYRSQNRWFNARDISPTCSCNYLYSSEFRYGLSISSPETNTEDAVEKIRNNLKFIQFDSCWSRNIKTFWIEIFFIFWIYIFVIRCNSNHCSIISRIFQRRYVNLITFFL